MMNGQAAIKECFSKGKAEYELLFTNVYFKALAERVSQCLNNAGVSADEIKVLIRNAGTIPRIQEKLKCSAEAATECMDYDRLERYVEAHMEARIMLSEGPDIGTIRHARTVRTDLRRHFTKMSGLGEMSAAGVLRNFDEKFDTIMEQVTGKKPAPGRG